MSASAAAQQCHACAKCTLCTVAYTSVHLARFRAHAQPLLCAYLVFDIVNLLSLKYLHLHLFFIEARIQLEPKEPMQCNYSTSAVLCCAILCCTVPYINLPPFPPTQHEYNNRSVVQTQSWNLVRIIKNQGTCSEFEH